MDLPNRLVNFQQDASKWGVTNAPDCTRSAAGEGS